LIPFYLIEDRIKENFGKIGKFIDRQQTYNSQTTQNIASIHTYNSSFKDEIARKFVELEKKIVTEIGS
jgi:hypothetical protein